MTNGYRASDDGVGEAEGGQDGRFLGLVVDGSLADGIEVRLDPGAPIEDVKVGTFVTIQGSRHWFFGVATEVALGSSDGRLRHLPPGLDDPFISQALLGTVAYGCVSVLPNLILPLVVGDPDERPAAAKTIPPHFSKAFAASEQDVAVVFGKEDERRYFCVGTPLDMQAKLCLDLDELITRSIGVFGKSGTGKTFLTRLLLVGILQNRRASSLIFDMHSEYGWGAADPENRRFAKGLKQLFPAQVSTFTLDEESSRRRGSPVDEVVRIGFDEIEPDDIAMLRETLNLSDVAASAAINLQQKLGRQWMRDFLNLGDREAVFQLANEVQVQPNALQSLYNRLSRLRRYAFLTENAGHDAANRIIEHLERGRHVVLEFGKYGRDLTAYMLVTNLLSRRIHERYVDRKEEAEGGRGADPRPLVIVIEEAHKFLSPAVASHAIFGAIAREMRKYNVTLMVIDQRPSGIDSEVMSQVGTRLTCLLDNDRDIEAVLSGVSGSRQLRTVLARLEAKQQALIFGHALPMPVVVRTRDYGSAESYAQLSRGPGRDTAQAGETPEERLERDIAELF